MLTSHTLRKEHGSLGLTLSAPADRRSFSNLKLSSLPLLTTFKTFNRPLNISHLTPLHPNHHPLPTHQSHTKWLVSVEVPDLLGLLPAQLLRPHANPSLLLPQHQLDTLPPPLLLRKPPLLLLLQLPRLLLARAQVCLPTWPAPLRMSTLFLRIIRLCGWRE